MGVSNHDFSPISGHCTFCALPRSAWERECVPSTDDSPEAIREIARQRLGRSKYAVSTSSTHCEVDHFRSIAIFSRRALIAGSTLAEMFTFSSLTGFLARTMQLNTPLTSYTYDLYNTCALTGGQP